jgi:hypothetical protein
MSEMKSRARAVLKMYGGFEKAIELMVESRTRNKTQFAH